MIVEHAAGITGNAAAGNAGGCIEEHIVCRPQERAVHERVAAWLQLTADRKGALMPCEGVADTRRSSTHVPFSSSNLYAGKP